MQKKNNQLDMDKFNSVDSRRMYDFLVDQRKEDITSLSKGKEVMFCGRSNIGKSSLINALFDKDDACRVSKRPVSCS